MSDFSRNGHSVPVDPERVDWLRRLGEAARAAADQLRALDDPPLHRALIDDLDAFRDRIVAELERAAPGGDQSER